MMFWVIIKVALRSLWANRLRSVLAMLGIIIGVSAVIVVLSLVAGARQSVLGRISALGTNLLVITPGQRGMGGVVSGVQQNLVLEDAQALLKIPGVRDVAPVVRGNVQVKYYNKNARTNLIGTSVTYFPIRAYEVEHGRLFGDAQEDAMARVAVLGPVTAQNLFGGEDPLNEMIKVNGINFRVIGVLKAKGDQGWFNPDDQVLVPCTTAMKQLLGLDHLQEIDIRAESEEDLDRIQKAASALLRKRHHVMPGNPDDVSIRNQAQMLDTASTVTGVMTLLAGGIASISLLVGGIGIMNIMLVTVTERTREIGVRKAIGAKDRDILRQFLIEAVLMSGLGGVIGVALGAGLSKVVGLFASATFQPVIQAFSVFLAIGFSAAVGIFFGYYPARRAAKLDPIEALRYE
jgi:putative ABC transport system permease protein